MTLPALNPIEAPDLICLQCGSVLRREIKKQNHTGRLDQILYSCDGEKCKYTLSISLEHKNGQYVPYSVPPAVEVPVAENPVEDLDHLDDEPETAAVSTPETPAAAGKAPRKSATKDKSAVKGKHAAKDKSEEAAPGDEKPPDNPPAGA